MKKSLLILAGLLVLGVIVLWTRFKPADTLSYQPPAIKEAPAQSSYSSQPVSSREPVASTSRPTSTESAPESTPESSLLPKARMAEALCKALKGIDVHKIIAPDRLQLDSILSSVEPIIESNLDLFKKVQDLRSSGKGGRVDSFIAAASVFYALLPDLPSLIESQKVEMRITLEGNAGHGVFFHIDPKNERLNVDIISESSVIAIVIPKSVVPPNLWRGVETTPAYVDAVSRRGSVVERK